jgi:hypothetical protein
MKTVAYSLLTFKSVFVIQVVDSTACPAVIGYHFINLDTVVMVLFSVYQQVETPHASVVLDT